MAMNGDWVLALMTGAVVCGPCAVLGSFSVRLTSHTPLMFLVGLPAPLARICAQAVIDSADKAAAITDAKMIFLMVTIVSPLNNVSVIAPARGPVLDWAAA